ncbi:MAG: phage tail sheath subtilisin-like domain-containing protein [Acidiphilium sp.]
MSTTVSNGTQGVNGSIAPAQPVTITYDEIPFDIQVPGTYTEVGANYSQAGLISYPAKALIIGQMLASGTAVANTPYPIYAPDDAVGLFGGSSIAADAAAAFIAANPWTRLFVIGVPDAAGAVKASATATISGTATASGTLAVYLGATRIAVPVAIGDTAQTVVGSLMATFGTLQQAGTLFAATASSAAAVVTFDAEHGGTLGNTIDLRLNAQPGDATPQGITVALTPFSGGATDPTIATALNAIASSWYTDIGIVWNDATNVGLLEAALATRYTAMGKLDAHGYRVIGGTPGTVQAAQAAYNCKFASTIAAQNPLDPTWRWMGAFTGVAAYYLSQDPSRQLRSLSLPGITAPAAADLYDDAERQILLTAGISTFTVEVDGTVALERVVTEYLTSADGAPDKFWHDIVAPRTMSRIRYDWNGYISLVYPRNKLADDGTLAAEYDDTVVTCSRLRASWMGRSRIYGELGWIENVSQTGKQSVFVRDPNDPNRVNARMQVQMLGNLMILAGRLEFSL